MASYAAKRPLDPRSRGHSPASKRSRPLQSNSTGSASPSIQSPSSSRRNSCAALPTNMLDGSKPGSDRKKPLDSGHGGLPQKKPGQGDQASTRSPTHTGSRASTPLQHSAPPAPSMLPIDPRQHVNAAQGQDKTATDKPPLSMQSLRKLQDRRRVIAIQTSSTKGPVSATSQMEARLTAQQAEIAQLRKEREQLDDRLKKMEDSLQSPSHLANGAEPQTDASSVLKPLLSRLDALEKSTLASQVQNLENEVRALKPVKDRSNGGEAPSSSLQRDLDELKSMVNRLEKSQAETANGTAAKISALENDILALKRSQEFQKNEVDILNNWKTSQSTTIIEDVQKLVTDKVTEKTDDVQSTIRNEITETQTRLDQRISSAQRSLENDYSRAKDVESLTATVKGLSQQLAGLSKKISIVDADMDKIDGTMTRIANDLQKIDRDHARSINDLQRRIDRCAEFCRDAERWDLPRLEEANEDAIRRLKKLEESIRDQNKLTEKSHSAAEKTTTQKETKAQTVIGPINLGNVATRVDGLERAEQVLELNQPGTPVISSAAVNALTRNVEELAKDFKNFQLAQKEAKSLESKLASVDQRLESVEQVSEEFGALVHQVVLDKSLEDTLAQLDRRISSEIEAVRTALDSKVANIQLQRPGNLSEAGPVGGEEEDNLPSLATTTALMAQIKDLQTEVDLLSDDFNQAGQKMHEQSAMIAVIKDQVPELFRQQFDPFKHAIEGQLSTTNSRLGAQASLFEGLRNEVANTKAACTQALENVADKQAVRTQLDSITFALQDLEHRYHNISTEEMHQKMVHWFVQTYPTSAALLKDTAQVQQDIVLLKAYCNEIGWVRQHARVLQDLCQHAAQLQALAQQHSPQYEDKMKQARSDAQAALSEAQQVGKEAHERVSQIATQIADIQAAVFQHRRDFDTMKDTLIEPNRDFFGLLGTVLAVLAQLQQAVEGLNQNLPGTPLQLDWEFYLPSLVEQFKLSAGNEDETSNSKQ